MAAGPDSEESGPAFSAATRATESEDQNSPAMPTRTPLFLCPANENPALIAIGFDVGSRYEGYWSDLARTYSFGEPSARVRQLYRAMVLGEQAGIDQTRPGMTGGEVFKLTMQAVRDNGEPRYRRHHVGHSIGAEVYEQPILADGNDVEIEAGMIINIETPYYEFGVGAVHVENPFVVAAQGPNVLLTSGTPRELVIL